MLNPRADFPRRVLGRAWGVLASAWRRGGAADPPAGREAASTGDIRPILSECSPPVPPAVAQHDLLAQIPQAVIATDFHGRIELFNPSAEKLFGHRADALVGQASLVNLHDPQELLVRADELSVAYGRTVATAFEAIVLPARETGRPDDHEWTCRRPDGTALPVGYTVTALRNGAGGVTGYVIVATDISRRRQAEARRRDLDLRLRKIAAHVPGMVFQFELRPDGAMSFPYVSEGVREIYRLSPVELLEEAEAAFSVLHPDDHERFMQSIHQSAATLERWTCEYRTCFADGSGGWLQGSAVPELQEDGAVLWSGFVTDITARKEAAHALEENRAFLQSIYTSVELGIFVVDVLRDGEFRYFESNRAHERTTGFSSERIKGLRPADLVPMISPETAAAFQANYARCVQADAPIEYEECMVGERGFHWFLTRLTPLKDADDRITRLVGSSLDITARKTIELRLQSISDRLQLATEAGGLGIWDYDLDAQQVTGDERMHALCGLPPGSFDGTRAGFLQLVHPADHARLAQELRLAVVEGRRVEISFRIIRPDGEVCELRTCALTQRGEDAQGGRLVGVCWDITRERRAQAELVRARDEAAAATIAKSAFLANMSHEIRTPLNAVIGMSSLLLGAELAPEQRELAETIRTSGNALLGILNDVLDYSKIESGRLELEAATFDLRACVDSALDVLAARSSEKGIELFSWIDPAVPVTVVGDATRLRQVLVNLLGNAVKFTSCGEILIEVRFERSSEGTPHLAFAVKDTGIGIPESRRDRLFQGFSQIDPSTTRQYGGSGLGLAICKHLVELMRGRIWYEGVEGEGSVFRFEVEIGEATAVAPIPAHLSANAPTLKGRRLLVVDGNATGRRLVLQQVAAWGLRAQAAGTPAEAAQWIAEGQCFDVALLAAASGGEGFIPVLRRNPATAGLPVILLTALGGRVPIGPGIAGGVAKPVKAAQLFALLVETLAGTGSLSTPAQAPTPEPPAVRHPLSLLLVEDNLVNQRVALLMLRRLGYEADVAVNGREAVIAIERAHYDLVFMDLQMPEMDGIEATRAICARWPADRRPRIVAMTANASTSDRDECFAVGMSDFLSKPVRSPELARVLAETPARRAPVADAAA
jgi:PAS domain S-box-containing protein